MRRVVLWMRRWSAAWDAHTAGARSGDRDCCPYTDPLLRAVWGRGRDGRATDALMREW